MNRYDRYGKDQTSKSLSTGGGGGSFGYTPFLNYKQVCKYVVTIEVYSLCFVRLKQQILEEKRNLIISIPKELLFTSRERIFCTR